MTTIGQKVLEALTARCGLASRLAVLDDGYVVALLPVDGPGPVQLSTYLGRRDLPHCSGVGKAILGRLSAPEVDAIVKRIRLPRRTPHTITTVTALRRQLGVVRRQGNALDDEEDHEGVFCVGAAFCDRDNAPSRAIKRQRPQVGLQRRRSARPTRDRAHACEPLDEGVWGDGGGTVNGSVPLACVTGVDSVIVMPSFAGTPPPLPRSRRSAQ